MKPVELEALRASLEERRQAILRNSVRTEADIGEIRTAERDPELEEASQSEQQQYTLAQLAEVERDELARIDAALQRMDAGEYGSCRDCGAAIDVARLRAVPFALECPECASRREEARAIRREVAAKPRRMPPR